MKHFAKSLVSVVIALSILATMCIVGISVSAEATSGEFVFVSGTATKNVSDMSKTISAGTATMEVVNSSTLGTAPSGVPATAYKTTVDTAYDGIHIKAPSTDASAATGNGSNALIIDAWIYVSDASKMTTPILRLYSAAASADTNKTGNPLIGGYFAQANMKTESQGFVLQTGWNHLVTTTNKFSNGAGLASLPDTIVGFSLHDHAAPSGAYTLAVASMKIYWDSNLGKAPNDGRDYLVSCVPFEGGASGTLVDATYDGGTAAYQNTSGVVAINKTFTAKDLTGKYVTAWIYVEDVTKLGAGNQFELRDGTNDTNEINFNLVNLGLKNGWNKVTLDPNGGEAYGTVKFSGKAGTLQSSYTINSMRVFAEIAAGVKVGTVYVTPANEMPVKPAEPKDSYTLFVDSAETGYTGVAGEWDTADKKEGEASYKIAGTSQAAVMIATEMVAEQDWNGYFWYYIEDTTKLNELYFEISSSGSHSGACVRYLINGDYKSKLKNGWNKIEFKLHDSTDLTNANGEKATTFSENYKYCLGGGMTGNVDWSKINYIRIISNCVANSNVVVKYNAFTLAKPVVEPVKDTREYLISAKEGEDMATGKWEAAEYLNTGNGAYGGTGVVRAQKNLDGVDITGKQITLWLYTEDPTKFANVDIELTSSGKCDSNELCFRLAHTDLKKGWNKYVLDSTIAKAASANGVFGYQHINGGGTVDLTKINYIRIFGTDNTELKVGAMYFTDSEMKETTSTGDATNVAMVVVAILLAAMAASVTVYFGKKAR